MASLEQSDRTMLVHSGWKGLCGARLRLKYAGPWLPIMCSTTTVPALGWRESVVCA